MMNSRRFQKVHIEISNVCNLQCSFCPEVERKKQLMDVDLFKSIIAQVSPLTEQVCFHLMGEPLTHPHLQQFVEICAQEQVRIFLVSNGVLLNPKHAATLLHPAFRQVNFSLHSFANNFPGQDMSGYLQRIFSFTEEAFKQRPDLYINYRVWNLQAMQLQAPSKDELLTRICEYFAVPLPAMVDVRRRKNVHLLQRLYLHFDTEFRWPHPQDPILGQSGRCHGLGSHFGILADGSVVPCCLDKEKQILLGNLQTQRLTDILQSPRAQKIRQGFLNGRLVEPLCQRCGFIQRFSRQKAGARLQI